ncbi:hypothetical protein BHM03_00054531 [Ensete ventricosum]|nr:hypothetical protein BHM03_00054531 [Ensete ventricosum]
MVLTQGKGRRRRRRRRRRRAQSGPAEGVLQAFKKPVHMELKSPSMPRPSLGPVVVVVINHALGSANLDLDLLLFNANGRPPSLPPSPYIKFSLVSFID